MAQQQQSRVIRRRNGRRRINLLVVIPRFVIMLGLVSLTIVLPISGFTGIGGDSLASEQLLGVRPGESWSNLTPTDNRTLDRNLSAYPSAAIRSRIVSLKANCKITSTGSGNSSSDKTDSDKLIIFPLPKGKYQMSSPFGMRVDPISGATAMHTGQDYAAPAGTPIRALAKGVVVRTGHDPAGANLVVIKHDIDGQIIYSGYYHMLEGSIVVHEGQQVEAGDLIALVGSTGYSTGNHLHLEIRKAEVGQHLNPAEWLKQHTYVFFGEQCD